MHSMFVARSQLVSRDIRNFMCQGEKWQNKKIVSSFSAIKLWFVIYVLNNKTIILLNLAESSSETQGQIVGPKTKIKTKRKRFCPIRSEYSFGRLELVRKEFVPRDSYFSFVFLLVEFFPARFDFRLRPHYLPLGLRGCCGIGPDFSQLGPRPRRLRIRKYSTRYCGKHSLKVLH